MQNRLLLPLILIVLFSHIALADEIIVVDADAKWNLTLENATSVHRLVGEPDVMVVKYADAITYNSLENPTSIGRLVGEPEVMVIKYADAITSFDNTPPAIITDDRSLFKVEGKPEVYWLQNGRLYWVTDWDVISQMSGISGWGSVNILPASEFNPATYPHGPRFITTGTESDGLLIREQGDIKVYLILGGEKHHFTSPEALTWNGYGFDDVIEVSSTIVGMFPEGTPVSIQDKRLLRKPGGIDVYWSQNGKLYYVTADALNRMLDLHGWGWDEINEPADFSHGDSSQYRTFITTGHESNGVLIRLWGDYRVYRIEDGFRRHITHPDVMELSGYAMEDVIDVSQEIIDMFPVGDPIGIEVNLAFNKTTDSGEEPCTKFTTGETVKFYTETTVSDSYTVDTYAKLTEPDGRTRYAYHTDPDFQPTDPLSFSDAEVPLYPGHWDAVSNNWNWNEYTFTDDVEGVYTWEFYYKDVISGKVLGWDMGSYVFTKKTDLDIQLELLDIKCKYGKNERIDITAFVHDSDGNAIVANDFSVMVTHESPTIECSPSNEPGEYKLTGARAPNSPGKYLIDVSVETDTDNVHNFTEITVEAYITYKVLMILACPDGLCVNSQPTNVDEWYNDHGTPQWYKDLEKSLNDYYWDISYNTINLDVTTTDWLNLDERYEDRIGNVAVDEYNEAVEKAESAGYTIKDYDIVVITEPTYGGSKWQTDSGGEYLGFYFRDDTIEKGFGIFIPTPYNNEDNTDKVMINSIDHEITHAIDGVDDEQGNEINGGGHGDDDIGGPCIMCPNTAGVHHPFNPANAWKMGFSTYQSYTDVDKLKLTLLPIEGGPDRSVRIANLALFGWQYHYEGQVRVPKFTKTEANYWIEFRDGSWGVESGVLVWKSEDQSPRDENALPNWDQLKNFEFVRSPDAWYKWHRDWLTGFMFNVKSLTNTAEIEIIVATDVFVTANKTSAHDYDIEMHIVGSFFEDFPYNFSVIDTLNQSEVFNSTLTTNANGEFDSPIAFNATLTDNIEAHPYLIRVHTVSGWVPFLIATPSLIDGISNETPFFTASDPAETNTAGDLTNLTSTCGSIKLSLKTAAPVDTGSYRYVIYLDSDNSTETGYIINGIGVDHKIEYTGAGAGLYKYNTSWTLVDTPYLNASHNETNIEILTTTEIMNRTDTVKLVAQTFDSSDTLHDTLPDPTATPPYLEFMDVPPMDMRFAEYGYYAGDNVTVNGYGFAQNQTIPIAIMNQTGHVPWNGSVQADSDGQIINVSTWTVPDDFYGTAYLYWAGTQMDSFSRLTPPLPVYNAEFELDAPMVTGVGREFNVTVSFENIGDDLANLTLNLNTSGMTSEPETVWVGDLTSGQNYTRTWNLTPTCSGFALLKGEVCSNQSTFVTDQKGIYIANVSAEINAPNDTAYGSVLEFNVSVTNNQENITYTDLRINTSIKGIETNFTQPVIALPPGQTVNQSYLWDTSKVTPGTYQIIVNIISSGVVLSSSESGIVVNASSSLKGDLNHDGNITSVDAAIVLEMAARGEYNPIADVNDDKRVTSLDALVILQAAAATIS